MTHGKHCPCTACVLARAYDGTTAEEDLTSQQTMAAEWLELARQRDGIADILSDEAGVTSHDRDSREPEDLDAETTAA